MNESTSPAPRLLVVDDEPEVAELIGTVAGPLGFEVRVVHDAPAVRGALAAFDPAVIVLDLVMPGEGGVEVMHALAAAGSRARVILITGLDRAVLDHARRVGQSAGLTIAGTVMKPFANRDLERLLAAAASAPRQQGEGR